MRGRDDCDALVTDLPEPALVINATGLGKDTTGSPVTDRAPFGRATLAWDFNYRGTLIFLRQAAARGARTMDRWDYFVAGRAGALPSRVRRSSTTCSPRSARQPHRTDLGRHHDPLRTDIPEADFNDLRERPAQPAGPRGKLTRYPTRQSAHHRGDWGCLLTAGLADVSAWREPRERFTPVS